MNNPANNDRVSGHRDPHINLLDCVRQCGHNCSQQYFDTNRGMETYQDYLEKRHDTVTDTRDRDCSRQCSETGSDIKYHDCSKHHSEIDINLREHDCSAQHSMTDSIMKDQEFPKKHCAIVSDIKGCDMKSNDCSRQHYEIGCCDMSEGHARLQHQLMKPPEKENGYFSEKDNDDMENTRSLITSPSGGSGDSLRSCYHQEYEVHVAYRVEIQQMRGRIEAVDGRSPASGHEHTQKGFHRRHALRQALIRIRLQRQLTSKISDHCNVLTNVTEKSPSNSEKLNNISNRNEYCNTYTCAEQGQPGSSTVTIGSDTNNMDVHIPIVDEIAGIDFWDEFCIDADKQDHVNNRYILNRDYYQLAWVDLDKDIENEANDYEEGNVNIKN